MHPLLNYNILHKWSTFIQLVGRSVFAETTASCPKVIELNLGGIYACSDFVPKILFSLFSRENRKVFETHYCTAIV